MNFRVLAGYAKLRKLDVVQEILKETETSGKIIDILKSRGILLKIVIEQDNCELMQLLIDYYEKNMIHKEDSASESSEATSRLAETIEEVIREEDGEISSEMRSVLSRYIDDDEIPEKIKEEELVFDDYDPAEATREIPIAEIFPPIEGAREASAEEREALGHCPDHS